jgi:UDP-N-acetylmuramyl pentapeptide synthase
MKPFTINQLYEVFCQHPVVTTDSRVCPEGSLFFALKGESLDVAKVVICYHMPAVFYNDFLTIPKPFNYII